ncbi:MAG: hypothetical protein P8I43_07620 [Bacteroidia bacterium]|jgi:hypothetical protein|nr:hypothetical protein [Bacteroidia bacterium]MDG2042556.1 hypothetical protein [Bacteroidia bacterium]|tara:strand:+ start:1860 stop:2003 length:144 start_codon:yes stop_codon:yes gene_type:complete
MNNQEFVNNQYSQYSHDIFALCEDFRQRLEKLNRLKDKILKDDESIH